MSHIESCRDWLISAALFLRNSNHGGEKLSISRRYIVKGLYAVIMSFVCIIAVSCTVKESENAGQTTVFHIKMLKIGKADTALL